MHIDIMPEQQGSALGKPFLSSLFRTLRDARCQELHLEMAATNMRAWRFYSRLGFRKLCLVRAGSVVQSWIASDTSPDIIHGKDDMGEGILYLGLDITCGETWNEQPRDESFLASNDNISKVLQDIEEKGCTKGKMPRYTISFINLLLHKSTVVPPS